MKRVFALGLVFSLACSIGLVFAQSQDIYDPDEVIVHPGPGAGPIAYARQSVLFDNGPLVNSVGTGVGGADESVLQSVSLGMNTLGFGHQVLNGYQVADDFVVPDPGWIVETIDFFAYQTGSTTTSTMTGVNAYIWDGVPGDPGSTIVATSTAMTATGWTGIYRVSETTTGTADNRPIMIQTMDFGNAELPPGTYWVAWQTDGSLSSGPWAPPVTINGTAVTGNGLQSLDNGVTWAPANDSGTGTPQQGLPFIIIGTSLITIPTLGTWGLIAFLVALGGAAVVIMRRRA